MGLKRYVMAVSLIVFVACAGCATRQADLTLISTRDVHMGGIMRARQTQNPMPVNGYDCRTWLLIFPVSPKASIEDAVDDAMDQANGDCMVDVVIYRYWWYIPFIYGKSGWKVRGRVLNTYLGELSGE